MIQAIYRQSTWQVLKDFIWWYFLMECNEFHPRLNLKLSRCVRSIKSRNKEYKRIADARYRAHRLDILYQDTIRRD